MRVEGKTPVVLVAISDSVFLEFISGVLKGEGYEVLIADDGNEAVRVLFQQPFDLALLDVNMPHWNGITLCKILKSSPQSRLVPVVLITDDADSECRIEGINAGADEFASKSVNIDELKARLRSLLKLKFYTDELEHAEGVLFSLARCIEARDRYTRGHCERLSTYSVALAEKLRLSDEEKIALRRAGIVHDIGKVVIPDEVLLKFGPLSPLEWELMRLHTVVGADICAPLRTFRLVIPIILYHHERMNGSGYPHGLKGDEIPLTARILATVDVFDALTTKRPYKKAYSVEKALEMMRSEARSGLLDPFLVDTFAILIQNKSLELLHKADLFQF
jgi:cyclic di-GMP phosphodiesterase